MWLYTATIVHIAWSRDWGGGREEGREGGREGGWEERGGMGEREEREEGGR